MMQLARIRHSHTLFIMKLANFLFLYGFYKEKCNFFSQEKFFCLVSSGTQATDPSEGNI
jgi:hypothetical protein